MPPTQPPRWFRWLAIVVLVGSVSIAVLSSLEGQWLLVVGQTLTAVAMAGGLYFDARRRRESSAQDGRE